MTQSSTPNLTRSGIALALFLSCNPFALFLLYLQQDMFHSPPLLGAWWKPHLCTQQPMPGCTIQFFLIHVCSKTLTAILFWPCMSMLNSLHAACSTFCLGCVYWESYLHVTFSHTLPVPHHLYMQRDDKAQEEGQRKPGIPFHLLSQCHREILPF